MTMLIYIYDDYYENVLENTIMHIHGQSCGYTMTLCMACEKVFSPKSTNEEVNKMMLTDKNGSTCMYGGFFFIMCADCRTEKQKSSGRIPTRSTQRCMVEKFLAGWSTKEYKEEHRDTNPYLYENVYVVSVENGVEMILLVANKNRALAHK